MEVEGNTADALMQVGAVETRMLSAALADYGNVTGYAVPSVEEYGEIREENMEF